MTEARPRSITVCITEVNGVVTPFYTYVSPNPPYDVYIDSPECSTKSYHATNLYYMSDYATINAGWTVVNAVGNPNLPPGPVTVDPNGDYIIVNNPHTERSAVYQFYLVYENPAYPGQPGRPANQYWFDPEDGNVP